MTFTLLDGSWVAHAARFTVQCVDRYRVVYADADALMTLDTDLAERRLTVSPRWMTVVGTDEASDHRLGQIATRTVFALAAMGLASDLEASLVSESDGPALLLDFEGLDVGGVLGLAGAVRTGGPWVGRSARLEPMGTGFRWSASSPLPHAFGWELGRDQADALVDIAASGLFASVPGTLGFTVGEPDRKLLDEHFRMRPRDGSYVASFSTRTEPGRPLDVRIVGRGSTVSGQVLAEAVPGFLLAGLGLMVDQDGWSHQVDVIADPGASDALGRARTVADFLDVWGRQVASE